MVACEKCWRDANGDPDEYHRLLHSRNLGQDTRMSDDKTEKLIEAIDRILDDLRKHTGTPSDK